MIEVNGPELVLDESAEATPSALNTAEKLVDLDDILAEERKEAHIFFKRLGIENTFVARLAVKLPEIAESVAEKITGLKETVAQVQDQVTQKIRERERPLDELGNVDRLPLSDLTADEGLMKKADIKFDAATATWQAVWKKPAFFHFGMILHPELMDQVREGEKLYFESKGMKLALVRGDNKTLMVEQSNGSRHELSAKRLEGLLQRSITVDGMDLMIDAGGNLILRAVGERAKLLASSLSRS